MNAPIPRRHRAALRTFGILTIIALATGCAAQWSSPSPITVNQLGYLPQAEKIIVVTTDQKSPLRWVLDGGPSGVMDGQSSVFGPEPASGEHLHKIDLSALEEAGEYRLSIPALDAEASVRITPSLLDGMARDALAYFYYHRLGVPIEPEYAPTYARPALHPRAGELPAKDGWTDHRFDVRYSWADAGDFGVYPVNHAVSAWTLANLFERYGAFADGSLAIPENNNGTPDVLDEVMFGSTFMAGLMPPTGLVPHKVHNDKWSAFPVTVEQENKARRWVMKPSTNATWAVARTYAHLARLMRPYDSARAQAMLATAEDAYQRGAAMPDVDYTDEDDGGGSYADAGNEDDHYAAAVELYLSTGAQKYRDAVRASPRYGSVVAFDWMDAATSGTLSLLTRDNDLPAAELETIKRKLVDRARTLSDLIRKQGYPTPLKPDEYIWGSNGVVLNAMIVIAYAYDLTEDRAFLRTLFRAMDYLLGVNANRLSFITGYGDFRERDLHDRLAWGAYIEGTPFPAGWIVGGPNNQLINDKSTPKNTPPAVSYAGPNTSPTAWCSKENAINWNAPLVWVAWYLKAHEADLAASQ